MNRPVPYMTARCRIWQQRHVRRPRPAGSAPGELKDDDRDRDRSRRLHSERKNMWPRRTTMATPLPTIADREMGPNARESQASERLSPMTKYWFWLRVVLGTGVEPTGPKRGSYHPRSYSGRPSTKIVLPTDQIA